MMRIRSRCARLLTAVLALAGLVPAVQAAEDFPAKPITLIVPFPAGGATDRQLRVLAQEAGKILGQTVVVENRPGAGGTMAVGSMAHGAKPDGYTISQYTLAMPRMAHMQKVNWHPLDDFDFIMGVTGYVFGVTVRADSPYKNLKDYIEAARAKPNTIDYGSTGTGSSPHLLMEDLAIKAGVKLVHVPFKGSADMQQALLGGHIMAESDVTSWDSFVDSGKMRLLATFGEKRIDRWPDAPTAKELGYDVVFTSPYGLVAPKGAPPERLKILHDAFKKALFEPATLEVLKQLTQQPEYRTGEEYKAYVANVYDKDRALIERLGLLAK